MACPACVETVHFPKGLDWPEFPRRVRRCVDELILNRRDTSLPVILAILAGLCCCSLRRRLLLRHPYFWRPETANVCRDSLDHRRNCADLLLFPFLLLSWVRAMRVTVARDDCFRQLLSPGSLPMVAARILANRYSSLGSTPCCWSCSCAVASPEKQAPLHGHSAFLLVTIPSLF